jgi:hypothetical protein
MDPRYQSPTAAVVDGTDGFRDLATYTTALTWTLRAGAALAIVGILSSSLQLDMLSRGFSQSEGAANAQRVVAVAGATVLLRLFTFFFFGRWIVLAHRNLDALGAQYLEYTPGWAVGWFFIPIANFWKPFQAMRSLWRNSHSVRLAELQEDTWVLPTWWALWLLFVFMGYVSQDVSMRAHDFDGYRTVTQLAIAGGVVDVALCAVASVLVARIWRAQDAQRESPETYEPPKGFADGPPEISPPR